MIGKDPDRNSIRSISLFGSQLYDDTKEGSDVDLILELDRIVGLFTLGRIKNDLEENLGREVDLIEKESLSKHLRDEVLPKAEKIYEKEER